MTRMPVPTVVEKKFFLTRLRTLRKQCYTGGLPRVKKLFKNSLINQRKAREKFSKS